VHHGRPPKIYYATQVGVEPPTIVLFCSNPAAISQTYRRYLLGVFRERLPFREVPIKLYLRRREEREKPPAAVRAWLASEAANEAKSGQD
jgi:GTP-binding protein